MVGEPRATEARQDHQSLGEGYDTSQAKGTRTSQFFALVARPGGATSRRSPTQAPGQPQSVRGFMGNAGLRSEKNAAGERIYRAA